VNASTFGRTFRVAILSISVSLLSGLSGACVDESQVFESREFFPDDPEPAAGGMLGYLLETPNRPVCANCHATPSNDWVATKHAKAWDGLQASGSSQAFCENCHTVSQLGNAATEDVGWPATMDARYHDVQCESCHGQGETHVADPTATQPLPSLAVSPDATNGCGECHTGTHHPQVDEWFLSPHAQVVGFAASRTECAPCHRGQGTLDSWGVKGDYVEKDSEDPLPVVCGVCHDPHSNEHEGQLRFPVLNTSIEEHLCARCHDRRSSPDPNDTHGLAPHSPESALLVGQAGWLPPGADFNPGDIIGTHGTGRNAGLCATCHVVSETVTDTTSGGFVFQSTGHLFRPIPCVDENGVPLPFENDCPLTTEARSFKGCTVSGCHGSEESALRALERGVEKVQPRADSLLVLLTIVDPNLDAPGGEIDPTNTTFNVAEGSYFNYELAVFGNEDFGTNSVIGSTVHNPFLMEQLLDASIDAVLDTYFP
jgi:hypothetical protein